MQEVALRALATAVAQTLEVDLEAELFLNLTRGLLGCFAESPVAGRCRVPPSRKRVFLERAPLHHDLRAGPHDPAVKRLVPVAVVMDRRSGFSLAGGPAGSVEHLQQFGRVILLHSRVCVAGHRYAT